MTVADWLAAAIQDAERRGLPELKPMLETLARATEALRKADAGQSIPARADSGRYEPMTAARDLQAIHDLARSFGPARSPSI